LKNKFLNIFHKREKHRSRRGIEIEIPTTPLSNEQSSNDLTHSDAPASKLELRQLIAASAQSIGKVRDHNEDSIFSMTTLVANNGKQVPAGLYIVADGMGGHQQGEVASNIAVRTVAREVIQRVMLAHLEDKPDAQGSSMQEVLEESVMQAHRAISNEAPGSGTTLTAAFIFDQQMAIAHVGDSRLYFINSGFEATILTRDHSLVKRMIELGHLTEEQASVHPQRNVLYRALGQGEPFSPDTSTIPLQESGIIMLCSDGLWGMMTRAEITQIITSNPALEIAAQKLVDAANMAGGTDNISVILVRLPETNE
jgi:serine/threonine protein phosphatase PrpC